MATIQEERGGQPSKQWRGTEVTAKFVCDCCNNGWMSALESRMKTIVPVFLNDRSGAVDSFGQATVAAWAAKTAMIFEALRVDPPWFYTNRERDLFRESSRPPARTNVWIAKCVGHEGVYCSAFDMSGNSEGAEHSVRIHLTTMAFGSLAIQVAGGKFPDSVPLAATVTVEQTTGPWEQAAFRIWPAPSEKTNWPPLVQLAGRRGLEALENRWGPHLKDS